VIDREAQVDASAEIGPYAVIEARADIGPGCRIGSLVFIGAGVSIGRDWRIGTNASVSHALLGARVYIYPGARIGQEGFSFATTSSGFLSVPQLAAAGEEGACTSLAIVTVAHVPLSGEMESASVVFPTPSQDDHG